MRSIRAAMLVLFDKCRGKLFIIATVLTMTLTMAEVLNSVGQGVWYSTSTSYAYTTEPFVKTMVSTKTDWEVREWFSFEASTNIEDPNHFVLRMKIKNNLKQSLMNVQFFVGFRFRNGTWTKPYVGGAGDFGPEQDRVLDLHIYTNFNLYEVRQPEETEVKNWKIYYVEASTTEPATTTRTLTYQVVFTLTSKTSEVLTSTSQTSTPPRSALSDNIWATVIAVLAIVAVILAVLAFRKKRPA
ncbi:MAG: hypothetical protein V1857_00880 [archaeon]